ncbi:hypothetical protein [Catenulispora sp. GAS73]|uniref:hypothetical protein n=1 Tax=Catenulispora sp. GAS73 TaxID=3156269 RepID=UPI003518B65F
MTASLVTAAYELRCHLVTASAGWSLREGGHAVASDVELDCESDASGAWAVGDGVRSMVLGVFGYESAGVVRYEGANALGMYSAAPYLFARASSGESVHVALHVLDSGADIRLAGAVDAADVVEVEVSDTQVTARWAEGSTVTVNLGDLFESRSTDVSTDATA